MPEKATRDILAGLLESQITGVLATENEHQPYANLVAFSFSDDLRRIFFATPRNTSKYHNLVENPLVSIIIDSRRNDPYDFSGSIAITALGHSRELDGDVKIEKLRNHSERLPGLSDFLKVSSIALFEIEVHRYIIANGLDATSVFVP